MNIKSELLDFLRAKGCKIKEKVGILYITTPDDKVWDMTVPMCLGNSSNLNGLKICENHIDD